MEVGGCHFWRSWRSFGAERSPKGCILEVKTELNRSQNLYKNRSKNQCEKQAELLYLLEAFLMP